MAITKRQQAINLIEQYDIDSDAFLEYLISDYLDSSMLLGAVKSYVQDELGVEDEIE